MEWDTKNFEEVAIIEPREEKGFSDLVQALTGLIKQHWRLD